MRALSRRMGATIMLAVLLCLFFSPTFRYILRGKLFGHNNLFGKLSGNSNLYGGHNAAGGYNQGNMMMAGGAPYLGGSGPWEYRYQQQEQLTSLAIYGIALGAFAIVCLVG
ncbi:hypothetical protein ACHQM5_014255 [Ranunculus cassubicifolius]